MGFIDGTNLYVSIIACHPSAARSLSSQLRMAAQSLKEREHVQSFLGKLPKKSTFLPRLRMRLANVWATVRGCWPLGHITCSAQATPAFHVARIWKSMLDFQKTTVGSAVHKCAYYRACRNTNLALYMCLLAHGRTEWGKGGAGMCALG